MGPQAQLVPAFALVMARQPIGVHALAGGMVGGEVQVVEAVELAGDVILLKDLKAHGTEGVIQVVAHLGDGVQTTAEGHGAGDGDVKVRVHLGGLHLQLVTALVQQSGQLSFHLVDGLAHLGSQGYVQLGQLLHQLGQAALLAQQRGLDVLQLRLGGDGDDALLALGQQLFQFFFHVFASSSSELFNGVKRNKKHLSSHVLGRKANFRGTTQLRGPCPRTHCPVTAGPGRAFPRGSSRANTAVHPKSACSRWPTLSAGCVGADLPVHSFFA